MGLFVFKSDRLYTALSVLFLLVLPVVCCLLLPSGSESARYGELPDTGYFLYILFLTLVRCFHLSSPADPRIGKCSSRKNIKVPEGAGISKGFSFCFTHIECHVQYYPHATHPAFSPLPNAGFLFGPNDSGFVP